MDIKSGQPESHETPLPLDASHSPGVAPPTQVASNETTQMGPTFINTSGVDFTADASVAMAAGMAADADRRGRYAAAMGPMGAAATDEMSLPPVPEQVTVPASGNLYGQGNQPGA